MQNLIIKGDNIKGLKYLLSNSSLRSKIDLVYIDPPFATNGNFTITDERASTISNSRDGDVAYSDKLTGRKFIEFLRDRLLLLRTCFKKQGMIPRCCGFVNPQRATAQGRGWVSQPIGLGNQAPTIDLTRFAEYGDNMPLNSERPSGLRKKPSFEEKTRFQGK